MEASEDAAVEEEGAAAGAEAAPGVRARTPAQFRKRLPPPPPPHLFSREQTFPLGAVFYSAACCATSAEVKFPSLRLERLSFSNT